MNIATANEPNGLARSGIDVISHEITINAAPRQKERNTHCH
ncbi:hypothetical protein J3D46_004840 [Paenarthrobacter sp. A20]|nr:hypothetical protein [Paenarthrobacter sp. A20]